MVNLLDNKLNGETDSATSQGSKARSSAGPHDLKSQSGTLQEHRIWWLAPAICFFVSLTVSLLHIFAHDPGSRIVQDSEFYFQTGQRLAEVILQSHQLDFSRNDFGSAIVINGPAVPLFIASVYALLGKLPSPQDPLPIFVAQAILQAFVTAVIAGWSSKLTRSRFFGLTTGLCWAFYPGTITSSCLLFAENLSVFTTVLLVWLGSCLLGATNKRAPYWAAAFGFCTGWLLLVRSALLPTAFVIGCLTLFGFNCGSGEGSTRGKGWKIRLFALVGVLSALIPWMVTSKVLTGTAELLPKRMPSWNLALGCDTLSGGWQTMPVTPFTVDSHTRKPLAIIAKAVKDDPINFGALMLRKVNRLWGEPWLDYHKHIFGLNTTAMTLFHQLVCLLGVLGILAACAEFRFSFRSAAAERTVPMFIASSSILIVIAHMAFIPFEALPRYALSAMPFLMLLSAFYLKKISGKNFWGACLMTAPPVIALLFLWHHNCLPQLYDLTGSFASAVAILVVAQALLIGWILFTNWRVLKGLPVNEQSGESTGAPGSLMALNIATISLAAIAAFVLIGNCSEFSTEWSCKLHGAQAACRAISLDSTTSTSGTEPGWAALLIDSDKSLDNALFEVNGHPLQAKPLSIYDVPTSYQYQQTKLYIMHLMVEKRGDQFNQIRQWRVLPVPLTYLNMSGINKIAIKPALNSEITIYGDFPNPLVGRRLPSLTYFTVGKLQYSLDALEGRVLEKCGPEWVETNSRSWLQDKDKSGPVDVIDKCTALKGCYRAYLMLGFEPGQKAKAESNAQKAKAAPNAADTGRTADKRLPTFVNQTIRIY